MPIPLLSPPGGRARPAQTLLGPLWLDRGRVHEFCGPSRHMLTVFLLRETTGPVIWVHPGWQAERLLCDGFSALADPARLILARAQRGEDVLWVMEESLRSGAAPLVVAEVSALPGLTAVRRLHLAAEAGAEVAQRLGGLPPLGLLLTPDDGGATGVESRWHLAPQHGPDRTRWQLSRRRARRDPPAAWLVGQDRHGAPRLLLPDAPATDHSLFSSA